MMINLFDEIRQDYDKGYANLLCLLNFSKAFDRVDHHIPKWKLKNLFGFSDRAVKLIGSYLSERFERVTSGGKSSSLKALVQGVPQGSILGPLLFCMFINYLFMLCIFMLTTQLSELALLVNEDLSRIYAWSVVNGLLLNPLKSQVIPISKRKFSLNILLLSIALVWALLLIVLYQATVILK